MSGKSAYGSTFFDYLVKDVFALPKRQQEDIFKLFGTYLESSVVEQWCRNYRRNRPHGKRLRPKGAKGRGKALKRAPSTKTSSSSPTVSEVSEVEFTITKDGVIALDEQPKLPKVPRLKLRGLKKRTPQMDTTDAFGDSPRKGSISPPSCPRLRNNSLVNEVGAVILYGPERPVDGDLQSQCIVNVDATDLEENQFSPAVESGERKLSSGSMPSRCDTPLPRRTRNRKRCKRMPRWRINPICRLFRSLFRRRSH